MTDVVKVFLVDDHKMVRAGLRTLLQDDIRIRVVGEAGSKAEALAQISHASPDVVLMDVRLPDGPGYEACAAIKLRLPDARVIVLTSFGDDDLVLKAIGAGADGYLLKDIDGADLSLAILAVKKNGAIFSAGLAQTALAETKIAPANEAARRYRLLTIQERRVLTLVAQGKTNKEIGVEIGLGEKTVRNYFSSVLAKLGLSRRTEAATWFIREIGPPKS